MAIDVKKVIQELVVPELRELKSEMKSLHTEIKRIDEKVDSQGARLDSKIDSLRTIIDTQGGRVDDKIDALRTSMESEFRRLDEKIDLTLQIRERLVSLEAKMSAFESRN